MSLADWFRWDVMIEGLVLLGFAIAVIQTARIFRAPPPHVYLIALSYGILVVGMIIEIHGHLGDPGGLRLIFTQFSVKFGLAAMLVMYRYYTPARRKIRHELKSDTAAGEMLKEVERRKE